MHSTHGHFGEYNHVSLVTEGDLITGLCDRARRKPVVAFHEEELTDLARPVRPSAELRWTGALLDPAEARPTSLPPDEPAPQVRAGGRVFTLTGRSHTHFPMGFGRRLMYHPVATDRPDGLAVLLTVDLPDRARYRVHWTGEADGEGTYRLAHGMVVTVLTDLPWTWDGATCTVRTADTGGRVTYLIESVVGATRLHRTVLVAAPGHERDAVRVRACLGRDFVPSFVVGTTEWSEPGTAAGLLADLPGARVLTLGLPMPGGLDALDAEVVPVDPADRTAGTCPRPRPTTVTAPDRPEAYGPALHLALRLDADLAFGPPDGDLVRWSGGAGTPPRSWLLSSLLGRPLTAGHRDGDDRDPTGGIPAGPPAAAGELVVCENTVADLLVCQAVGYAQLRGCDIAFVPEIANEQPPASLPGAGGVVWFRERAAAAVPPALRAPEADTLTVFTRHLPLHLTPLPDAGEGPRHWMDRYRMAHLPGQLGSVLVPRKLLGSLEPAPAVSFGVVFDALSGTRPTEGGVFVDRLQRGLSHPMVLTGPAARGTVMEAALRHLDTDLVLLVAHGRDDHLEDWHNDPVPASAICGWHLRGRPVVFNNSCSSWTTTSRAFLRAGARAVIATLWPVANEFATRVATTVGTQLHHPDGPDIAALLREALGNAADGPEDGPGGLAGAPADDDGVATRAAYLFVGLPGTSFLDRPAFGRAETVAALTHTLNRLYDAFAALIGEGIPEVVPALYQGSTPFLRERLAALLIPGEPPLHLAPPWELLTLLDVDFLLARLDNEICRRVLDVLPPHERGGAAAEMATSLEKAADELRTMPERYERHMGKGEEDDTSLWLSDMFSTELLAGFAFHNVLPSLQAVAHLPLDGARDVARSWFRLAATLVTVSADRAPDGSVSDTALIGRIREGIPAVLARWPSADNGAGFEQELDLLGRAVDKAELADRFGAARMLLGEPAAAGPFFEAARDLARPGTPVAANAAAHLADVEWLTAQDGEDDLTAHHQALERQRADGDVPGASITATHLLLRAASTGAALAPEFVTTALAVVDTVEAAHQRVDLRCHLLSSAALYLASRKDHRGAARLQAEVVGHLRTDAAASAGSVAALAGWYQGRRDYPRAVERACADGAALEEEGLLDAAMRSFLTAADCALRAYVAAPCEAHIDTFLECSRRLGRLHGRRPPRLQRKLEDRLREVWEQTVSVQRQWAERGRTGRALAAYKAAMCWTYAQTDTAPGSAQDLAWRQLGEAYHPRNVDLVRRLAARGALRRDAVVCIGADGAVDIALTTVRGALTALPQEDRGLESGAEVLPQVLVGCIPFPNGSVTDTPPADAPVYVAGAAVFALREGAPVTLRHSEPPPTAAMGDVLYRAVWGSFLVPHRVEVILAPGVEPGAVHCVVLAEPGPRVDLRSGTDTDGWHIVLSPPDEQGTCHWLAELTILRPASAAGPGGATFDAGS
ncbi:CHAT domain-containing protein, partial [Streptomyces collinus]